MPQLTEASLADHVVTFHDPRQEPRTIRCAYVSGEDSLPHLLVFKDHEHRTVALVNQDMVLTVERQPPSTPAQTIHYNMPTMGAAGGAAGGVQAFNVAFPAPGQGIA
jgi:hypothetical protein